MRNFSVFSLASYCFIALCLASCNGDTLLEEKLATSSTITRLTVPFREHGYNNFNHRVISSEEELNSFISDVQQQTGWNDKRTFLSVLQSAAIDFNSENLMLYRMTEGSGSISLNPQNPTTAGDTVYVDIERNVPDGGTADMAYYALVYAVNKSIAEVHFDNGTQLKIIPNTEGDNIVPANCTAWFDGCNQCWGSGEQVMCTMKACAVYEPFRCNTWE